MLPRAGCAAGGDFSAWLCRALLLPCCSVCRTSLAPCPVPSFLRWGTSCTTQFFLPRALRAAARAAWAARWSLLAVAAQRAVAASLLELPLARECNVTGDAPEPMHADVHDQPGRRLRGWQRHAACAYDLAFCVPSAAAVPWRLLLYSPPDSRCSQHCQHPLRGVPGRFWCHLRWERLAKPLPNLMYLEGGVTWTSGGSKYISACSDGSTRNPSTFVFRGFVFRGTST